MFLYYIYSLSRRKLHFSIYTFTLFSRSKRITSTKPYSCKKRMYDTVLVFCGIRSHELVINNQINEKYFQFTKTLYTFTVLRLWSNSVSFHFLLCTHFFFLQFEKCGVSYTFFFFISEIWIFFNAKET